MLPQKFSAATTCSRPPPAPAPAVALGPLSSQPARNAATDAQATIANMRGRAGHAARLRERERHPSPWVLTATAHPIKTESYSCLGIPPRPRGLGV